MLYFETYSSFALGFYENRAIAATAAVSVQWSKVDNLWSGWSERLDQWRARSSRLAITWARRTGHASRVSRGPGFEI